MIKKAGCRHELPIRAERDGYEEIRLSNQ